MKQLTQSEIRKNGKVYKNVSSPATEGAMKQVTDIVENDGVFSVSTDGGKTYSPAGGGGGSTINYTKLSGEVKFEATSPSASNAFFVGTDAATWAVNEPFGQKALTSENDLGLVIGNSYTMSVNIDGTTKLFSGTVVDATDEGLPGVKALPLTNNNDIFVIYDHLSADSFIASNGSIILSSLRSSPTSATITNFDGELTVISPVTITNSAIKINSAVTMYINSSITVSGTKTNGSITLSASKGGYVSYKMEILDTPTEGLFEIINAYIPTIPETPAGTTDYNELENIPVINQDLSESGFTSVKDTYYRHTGATNRDYTKGIIYKCVETDSTSEPLEMSEITSISDVYTVLSEAVAPLLPAEKNITNASTNVSITGSASPYFFTVTDSDVSSNKFVRLYPTDDDTETWLNEHTLSSIITEESGKFTFKVDTATLPTAFNIKYVIENFL